MYREFEEFVLNNYNLKEEGINVKYYHSKRVALISKRLAQKLNFNYHDVLLATQIGLLHDIGRFYEYTRYGFYDHKNFDHGTLGVKILKKDNFIRKFNVNPADDEVLFNAIMNHDKYSIDKKWADNKFCKLIRDTDKIDILYQIAIKKIRFNNDNMTISPKVYNAFMNEEPVKYKDINSYADKVLNILGYIYDINYDESLKYIVDNNYLDRIYQSLLNKESFKRYFNEVYIYIEKRLNKC